MRIRAVTPTVGIILLALFAAHGRASYRAVAAVTPPVVNEPIVATFVAGDVTLTGEHLNPAGSSRALHVAYEGRSTDIPAESPLVHEWSDSVIRTALPPEVHSGQAVVTIDGASSAVVDLLVFEYTATAMHVPSGSRSFPLALALDAGGKLWINDEAHDEIATLTPGEPPVSASIPVPQADGPGIFAGAASGNTAPTHLSTMGEDIHVDESGSVWFTEGGSFLYVGPTPNTSRIIRYRPATGAFDCYNLPADNAEVLGVLADTAHDTVWYTEASLTHGNAIGSFQISGVVSDCIWTPDSGARAPFCSQQQVPACHTLYALPHPASSPAHIASDREGKIWFTEYWGTRLGRLDPSTGEIVELPLPPPIVRQGPGLFAGAGPFTMEFDAGGDLWVAEEFDATILRVRPSLMEANDCTQLDADGANPCVEKVVVNTDGFDGTSTTVTVGNGGRVWFDQNRRTVGTSRLGFVDTAHGDTIVLLPMMPGVTNVSNIVQDPRSGDVWFGEFSDKKIGRLRLASGDADGVPAGVDNCPDVYNPGQENHDRNFVDLSRFGRPWNDLTWPSSDEVGDVCDPDTDNDGIPTDDETLFPNAGCPSATGLTNPLERDSDGDLVLDGAECALGSDPASRASVPPRVPPGDSDRDGLPDAYETRIGTDPRKTDTDGDGVSDGVEIKFYGSNPSKTNGDGDKCDDAKEVASVNGDTAVNSVDLAIVGSSTGPLGSPKYVPNFDLNKDGVINSGDLGLGAAHFGICR